MHLFKRPACRETQASRITNITLRHHYRRFAILHRVRNNTGFVARVARSKYFFGKKNSLVKYSVSDVCVAHTRTLVFLPVEIQNKRLINFKHFERLYIVQGK